MFGGQFDLTGIVIAEELVLSFTSVAPDQGWRPFWGHVPKLFINFEEILSRVHGNCEEQNKVLKSSIIIINYWIFIINALFFIIDI